MILNKTLLETAEFSEKSKKLWPETNFINSFFFNLFNFIIPKQNPNPVLPYIYVLCAMFRIHGKVRYC